MLVPRLEKIERRDKILPDGSNMLLAPWLDLYIKWQGRLQDPGVVGVGI